MMVQKLGTYCILFIIIAVMGAKVCDDKGKLWTDDTILGGLVCGCAILSGLAAVCTLIALVIIDICS